MKLFLFLCLAILALPVYRHETIRWKQCYEACKTKHTAHLRLKNSAVCRNFKDRLDFKLAGTVDCEKADRETQITPMECANQKWRVESELVALYHRLFDAYWKLALLILPIMGWGMYLWTSHHTTKAREQIFFTEQTKFLRDIIPNMIQNPKSLPMQFEEKKKEKKNKRKKYRYPVEQWVD
jgi:hypothetical protein